jgi:biopolymer transport protein TolR
MEALSAAQRGKIRRLSQPRELGPDETGGELNIVPYLDIIVNILIFVLATIAVTFTASIETTPPSSKGGGVRAIESEALNLTVLIVNEGFSIKASGGNVAPGCEGLGVGIAVPKKGSDYDYERLTDCAARLKNTSDKFKNENQVFITANPGTEYQILINTIDALRRARNGDILFDAVNFKVSK